MRRSHTGIGIFEHLLPGQAPERPARRPALPAPEVRERPLSPFELLIPGRPQPPAPTRPVSTEDPFALVAPPPLPERPVREAFEALAPPAPSVKRGAAFAPAPAVRPAEPVRRAPERFPERPKVPISYLEDIFGPLDELWDMIREDRETSDFRRALERTRDPHWTDAAEIPFVLVARAGPRQEVETARFLRIPIESIREARKERVDVWSEVLDPTMNDVAQSMTMLLPDDLPGDVDFGLDDEDNLVLSYIEFIS